MPKAETAVEITVLNDPAYLTLRSLQELFDRAFAAAPLAFPSGFSGMVEDIVELCQSPEAVVLVGLEDRIPKGLSIILFPVNKLCPYPQIFHFYNEGSLALRKGLTKGTVDIIQARGYVTFWAINATGKPDSVWARTFRLAGKSRPIGGVIEFDTTESA